MESLNYNFFNLIYKLVPVFNEEENQMIKVLSLIRNKINQDQLTLKQLQEEELLVRPKGTY